MSIAPPHQRDPLLRHFSFALSKAIYLGFQYLCPGNQSLFKGPFLCILNLSVFRLLTGVNICSKSVDSLRLKLYPEDVTKDESGGDRRADFNGRKIRATSTDNKLRSPNLLRRDESLKRKRVNLTKSNTTRSSGALHKNDSQCTNNKSYHYPRHHQVNFDVNQISPLLQQCLGRDCISLQPKRFIKRIELITADESETDQSVAIASNHSDKSYLEELAQHQSELKQKLKVAIDENNNIHDKARSRLAREKVEALKTRDSTEKMAASIMQKLVSRHKVGQKVLS